MSSFIGYAPQSVSLDLRRADEPGPALEIGIYRARELRRRTRRRIEALLHQRVADLGVPEQRVHLAVEQRYFVFCQPRGAEQRIPDVDVDIGDALVGERRDLGGHRRTPRATGSKHAQL